MNGKVRLEVRFPISSIKGNSMDIHILSLFPDMFLGPFHESIIKRAVDTNLVSIQIHNIRDYAPGRHRVVDDYPFGGGGGMVMKAEPLFIALENIKTDMAQSRNQDQMERIKTILLSPQGRVLNQSICKELSGLTDIILVCGRYEGIDERVIDELIDLEISIGDYILSGGELPAMVLVDSLIRLLPGALGHQESIEDDSHVKGILQFPQYTRPQIFRNFEVPKVLLSGDHQAIDKWRAEKAIERTQSKRPDLME